MRTWTEEVEANLGPTRRARELHPGRPAPALAPAWLQEAWTDRHRSLLEGHVEPCWVLRVSSSLTEPTPTAGQALVLYSPDPLFAATARDLAPVAKAIDSDAGEGKPWSKDPHRYALQHAIFRAHDYLRPMRVPPVFSRGRDVWVSSTILSPKDLPEGRLTQTAIPVLVRPDRKAPPWLVPLEAWPRVLMSAPRAGVGGRPI